MKSLIAHLRHLDWILTFLTIGLVGIGLLSMYSFSLQRGDFHNFQKQIVFFSIGIVFMLGISFLDWRLLRNDPYFLLFLYLLGVLALGGLFLFAPEIRGVKAWYRIGPISLDPIEYLKIVLILLMAKYFSTRHIEIYRIRHIFITAVYFIIPALLMFFQPNLGSVIVVFALWTVILLVAGISIRHFLLIILIGIIFFLLAWFFLLKDYQKERIIGFIEPELDPLGIGWSQRQSKIAIGNGGIFGQGLGGGTQTQYGFLPEPQTDFIYAAIAEEFGLLGVLFLFLFYGFFLWRILRIGLLSESNFPRLFAAGFATLLIIQISINIGMNLGLLPIIGLPLPFVSYGGSALIMSYIALGILQSIKTHQ